MANANVSNKGFMQPLLTMGPFGGLDATTEPYYVIPPLFADMENLVPNAAYGGYVTPLGRQVFAELPGRCGGFYRFARQGQADVYVYAVDVGGVGTLWYAPVGGTVTQLTLPSGATLTAGQNYSFAPSLQWLFLTNGVDTPLKIDSNLVVTYWGIVAPTSAPTLMAGASGNLNGTYYYCVTFGNANQESSQGIISNAITVTNNQVLLTVIPTSTDPQVTQRNIYRLGGGLGQWFLVGTINDNTTTTFVDNTADTAVTGQQLTVFRDPPQKFQTIISHQERIWGFGIPTSTDEPAVVYFSNVNEPWGFNNDTGNYPVGDNSFSDPAVGMITTGSILGLCKSESFYAVFGNDESNFSVQRIADVGCTSMRSCWSAYGIGGWLSKQGCYIFQGQLPQKLSDGNYQTSNIKKILTGLSDYDYSQCTGFAYDNMYFWSFPTINKTYFWDSRTQGWFVLGWALDQVYQRLEGDYHVLGTNQQTLGQIDNWFAAPGDFGGIITSYGTTGITDSGDPSSVKDYRNIIVEAPSANATLVYSVTVNPGPNAYPPEVRTINLSEGGPRYQRSLAKNPGAQVQLSITIQSAEQVHLQRFAIHGYVKRQYIQETANG